MQLASSNELVLISTGYPSQGVAVANYVSLFDDVVRRGVAAEDPSRHFHASCPSNGYVIDDIALGISVQRMGDPFDTRWGAWVLCPALVLSV